MKIGLVLTPFDKTNLQLAAQIGVEEIIYYDMRGMPDTVEELSKLRKTVRGYGMDMTIVEGGPPMDKIVLGKPGRDEQIDHFRRCLDSMGKAGFSVLCYSFMPWSLRVVRTSYETPTRGNALTSSFNLDLWDNSRRTRDGETTVETMWQNLEYFLQAVIPAAEAAGVYLALHPDDPPVENLCGLARIFNSVGAFERLLALNSSPHNGITFCQGCFSEMDADIPNTIRTFRNRIHFVHFRDVAGTRNHFVEVFPDAGKTNMLAALRAYKEIGFSGVLRPDHVPLLANEMGHEPEEKAPGYISGRASGYTMMGRLFAVGYMRGLLEAVTREP